MTNFGIALKTAIYEAGITQRDVARATGLFDAHISRLVLGKQRFLNPTHLLKILDVFEHDPKTGVKTPIRQAQILAAHCLDARIGPCANFVQISVQTTEKSHSSESDQEFDIGQRSLKFIARQISLDPNASDFVVSLAKMMGMKL